MKRYEVEVTYNYVQVEEVEAETQKDAEDQACRMVEESIRQGADWSIFDLVTYEMDPEEG